MSISHVSCRPLLGDWRALAWCWTVCCTDGRSAWRCLWAHSLLVSMNDQQVLWPELALGQRGRTWLSREAPVGALRYDWDGGPGRVLKMGSPEGWEGPSWLRQRALVWGHLWERVPWELMFHWSGLAERGVRTSVRTWRGNNSNIKTSKRQGSDKLHQQLF